MPALASMLFIGALAVGSAVAESGPPDGAAIFQARCARCHGESGKTDTAGARALKVSPLANDAKLARLAPPDIVKAITSNAKHQSLGAVADLDDTELGAVAIYVKELARKPR
jgi:mono/diheme cytochrome c family protein